MRCNNIPPYRVFTIFTLFFLVGILFASIFSIYFARSCFILSVSSFLILLVGLFNLVLKNKFLAIFSFGFLCFFLALSYYSFFQFKNSPNLIFDSNLTIEGKVVAKPEIDEKKQKVILEIESPQNTKGKIIVFLPHYPKFSYGDRIKFEGIIKKPGTIDNFDYANYLKKFLVFGMVTGPKDVWFVESNLSMRDKFLRNLYSISDSFEFAINRILPEPHSSLANGLILGLKKNLPDDYTAALQDTGLSHIVALSGYNVTIIVSVLSALLLGSLSRVKVFFLSMTLILLFIIMTGAASSIVRAGIFSLLLIFGRNIGRRGDFTNIMLLAAFLMVLFNPFILAFDIGFQLSFAAFVGILYLSPIMRKVFEKEKYKNVPEWIKSTAAETLSAQFAVLPLLLVVFGKVSFISPLANILVLPVIPLSMALSFFAGLFSLVFYPLGKFVALITWPILEYIIEVPKLLSLVPLSSINTEKHMWILALLIYVLLLAYILIMKKKYKLVY